MALESVVFQQDPYSNYIYEDLGSFGFEQEKVVLYDTQTLDKNMNWDYSTSAGSLYSMVQNIKEEDLNFHLPEYGTPQGLPARSCCSPPAITPVSVPGRRKRRRNSRTLRNNEEMETQRITHIAVERNRRKQMNEYLAVLRSLMPPSYAQRGDQASIVGGAINYVKELEQLLQSLEVNKQINQTSKQSDDFSPFAKFFTFPQYSTSHSRQSNSPTSTDFSVIENQQTVADIEVTMVENHATIKVSSRRNKKQLLKMINGFHSMFLTILHLNITTVDHMALYSFSVKVEDDCELTSVSEIATAVHKMVGLIQNEAISIL